jgi:hypothetical protein
LVRHIRLPPRVPNAIYSDDTVRAEEAPIKSQRVLKKRQHAADSDQEDDGASSDHTPTSRKRSSKQAALAKSAVTTVRRKKPVRATQPDLDDSSAIIMVPKRKAIKADSGIVPFLLLLLQVFTSVLKF